MRVNDESSSWKLNGLETQEKLEFQFKSKGRKRPVSQFKPSDRRGSFLLEGGPAFGFHSTDWVRATHLREGALLYSVFAFKCSSHLHGHTPNVRPNSWVRCSLVNLTQNAPSRCVPNFFTIYGLFLIKTLEYNYLCLHCL